MTMRDGATRIEMPLDYDMLGDCAAAGHPPVQRDTDTTTCVCGHRFYARSIEAVQKQVEDRGGVFYLNRIRARP